MAEPSEDIVLSEETQGLLQRKAKACNLCEWILRTYQQNGKLILIINFPVEAQVNHIAFEKSSK